jgi:hypothetical protein
MHTMQTHERLPTIVFSSVVRSTKQSESHGGVYLFDLQTEQLTQMIDWDDQSIDFTQRGGDRGLRGIAFHAERMFLAAADEIFIYDPSFRLLGSIKNPYLRHCHEINVGGDKLFLGSVGYDSILEYDIPSERFTAGYCIRYRGIRRRILRRKEGGFQTRPWPSLIVFDPNGDDGPEPGDTSHPSFPRWHAGELHIAGGGLGHIYAVRDGRLARVARIPFESHNAQLFRGGVLMNHSPTHRMLFLDGRGQMTKTWPVPQYPEEALEFANVPRDHAYQGFCRGITMAGENVIVQGSSPATINLFRWDPPEMIKSVNLTMDVRNSIHGLEIWPYAEVPSPPAALATADVRTNPSGGGPAAG